MRQRDICSLTRFRQSHAIPADMETRLASRYDLLQKPDDALASQQRQILELEGKLRLMATQMRELEPDKGSAPQDERPPHY